MARYKKVKDGEWVAPSMESFKMGCCDCGLVHNLTFQIVNTTDNTIVEEGYKVIMKASRNEDATLRARKHKGVTITKE